MEAWLSPTGVAAFLVSGCFLIAGLNQLFKLNRNLRGPDPVPPTPPNATLDARLSTIERDLKDHFDDDRQHQQKLEAEIKGLREDADRGRRRLYRRTDALNALVQRIAERLKVHTEGDTSMEEEEE